MSFHLAVSFEKPVQHLALSDWQARVDRLRNVANARRADAFTMRNTSRMLRNESQIEGDWANYLSDESLTNRIAELDKWRDLIAKAFVRLELEIEALREEKKAAESELDSQIRPLSVISKVMSIRDGRVIPEITHDSPETETKNELYILENNQRLLVNLCQKAWEKLVRLEEVRFKINRELKDKQDTEDTDSALQAMNRNSTNISYKPDPLRNPRECCSYEHWLEHAKNIKQLAENELAETSAIRNAMIVCRQKSRDLLEAQRARTEYTFRKRIFLTQQAKNELEWQQLKLREEIKNLTCEIQSLEDALQSKTGLLKLAETRLETRAMRCVTELCLDEPHHLLCNEVEKLREIQRCLMNKIDDAKANLNLLSDHAKKVDDDLENKKQSLQTDSEALQLHETLNEEEFAVLKDHNPCEQTDRNVELTRVVLDPRK
ncbi:tektin-2-like [Drosophila sulfurigaster albostrigata]|uniref:tektin-2-like n=1 Tax=Drosophila sulfurigaster albostrigata TaxID=89887 RepID=UPI002D21B36A|nr:tektin-2-like [Drosophila sulfurigaster albostrigata]